MTQQKRSEENTVVDGLPLRLSFEPDAIREHFDGDDTPVGKWVAELDDASLAEIGATALTDDRLYSVFHEVLESAVREEWDIEEEE